MKKSAVAADPDAYVAALRGWRRECVEGLRKYEMATIELREGTKIRPMTVRRLTMEAVALNESLGDPRAAAR